MVDNDNQQFNIPAETMEALYTAFIKRYEQEKEDKQNGSSLPVEITSELENTDEQQQEENFKRFRRSSKKYTLDQWTTPERINPELYKEINKHKTDTTTAISKIYDITETTRFQAKVASEIFEELQYIFEHTQTIEEVREILQRTTEQSKRLAIFGFAQTKNQERSARNLAIDALSIPNSLRHQIPKKESFKTTNAFSEEFLDNLYQARWEQDLLSKSVTNNSNNHFNKSRGMGYNRGGYRGNSRGFYKGNRGGRHPFFGQSPGGNQNNPSTNNNNPNNSLSNNNNNPYRQ